MAWRGTQFDMSAAEPDTLARLQWAIGTLGARRRRHQDPAAAALLQHPGCGDTSKRTPRATSAATGAA
jgi:hypothetical protein